MEMREDSKLFLKKALEYQQITGENAFELNIDYFKDIPNINASINDIVIDLIKNGCFTNQSSLLDLDSSKERIKIVFNVSNGGQVNYVRDYGQINVNQVNSDNQNDKYNNMTDKKFQNNKKQEYIDNWNNRLFLHQDNKERPLTLADVFIMPNYNLNNSDIRTSPLENTSLEQEIESFINYKRISNMLIKGVPGMGKTSITSWIANKYRDDDRIIILRFRDWEKEELEKGLLKAIYHTLECKKVDLNDKVLILDGFDEIKSLNSRKQLLYEFFNEILDIKNIKIIITSRLGYLDSVCFQNEFELLPFHINYIKLFYRKITGTELDERKICDENLDVLGIPVILYMAIMSKIDITKKTTKPELYNRIFAEEGGIFDRFSYKGNAYDEGSHLLRNRENIRKYLKFLREIAFIMFEKDNLSLTKKECKIPELEFQGDKISILEFPIKHLFESIEFNIEFIHKSILEYFIAEYIFREIHGKINKNMLKEELAGVLGDLFKRNILSEEILEFLKYRVRNSELNEKFDIVKDTFQLMLKDGMTYYINERYKNIIECEIKVFVNMLEIIHLWAIKNVFSLTNNEMEKFLKFNFMYFNLNLALIDLSKAYLSRTNLSKAYLVRAYLVRVYLSEANLSGANLGRANLSKADLRGANLSGANLSGAYLRGADLSKAYLVRAYLVRVYLSEANLSGANLSEANLSEAYLVRANLSEANLSEANLSEANLSKADLSKADLSEANLSEANLSEAYLVRANLDEANLRGADLRGAYLSGVNLSKVNLSRENLSRADLSEANLVKVNLNETNLNGTNLSGADLRGAYLVKTNLDEANLRGANLRGADLRGAYLIEANLDEANLSEANLRGAYLSEANLSGTDLSATDLRGAYLNKANLSEANLSEANLDEANLRGANLDEANLNGANLNRVMFNEEQISCLDYTYCLQQIMVYIEKTEKIITYEEYCNKKKEE